MFVCLCYNVRESDLENNPQLISKVGNKCGKCLNSNITLGKSMNSVEEAKLKIIIERGTLGLSDTPTAEQIEHGILESSDILRNCSQEQIDRYRTLLYWKGINVGEE